MSLPISKYAQPRSATQRDFRHQKKKEGHIDRKVVKEWMSERYGPGGFWGGKKTWDSMVTRSGWEQNGTIPVIHEKQDIAYKSSF